MQWCRPCIHLPAPSKPVVAVRFCPAVFSLVENVAGKETSSGKLYSLRSFRFELAPGFLLCDMPMPSPYLGVHYLLKALKICSALVILYEITVRTFLSSPFMKLTCSSLVWLVGFALPYRLVFAVATLDSLIIYDTQRCGPIVIFAGIHYAAITDIAWYTFHSSLMDLRLTCFNDFALVLAKPDWEIFIIVLFGPTQSLGWVEVGPCASNVIWLGLCVKL